MNSLVEIRAALDRMLSIGYGVVYDYIFERFLPYQRLEAEVRQLVEASVRVGRPHGIRVLEIPAARELQLPARRGRLLGDRARHYGSLVEVPRKEAPRQAPCETWPPSRDLARGNTSARARSTGLSIHSLYVHPAPDQLPHGGVRVLKPGGTRCS